jgi:hypothetical protein
MRVSILFFFGSFLVFLPLPPFPPLVLSSVSSAYPQRLLESEHSQNAIPHCVPGEENGDKAKSNADAEAPAPS